MYDDQGPFVIGNAGRSVLQQTIRENMTKMIKNMIKGADRVLDISPPHDYLYPSRDDFQRDMQALRGDCAAVGCDLQREIDRYGEQINAG